MEKSFFKNPNCVCVCVCVCFVFLDNLLSLVLQFAFFQVWRNASKAQAHFDRCVWNRIRIRDSRWGEIQLRFRIWWRSVVAAVAAVVFLSLTRSLTHSLVAHSLFSFGWGSGEKKKKEKQKTTEEKEEFWECCGGFWRMGGSCWLESERGSKLAHCWIRCFVEWSIVF